MNCRTVSRCFALAILLSLPAEAVEVPGSAVIPHVPAREMQFRRPVPFPYGARIQLFVRNSGNSPADIGSVKIAGLTPAEQLAKEHWAWHDTPPQWAEAARALPPGALTCWTWNQVGRFEDGVQRVAIGEETLEVDLRHPRVWIAAVTFLGAPDALRPDRVVIHVKNVSERAVRLRSLRLWLPKSNATFRHLFPERTPAEVEFFPTSGRLSPGDAGCVVARVKPLPLTYTAVELRLDDSAERPVTLWSHLRVKKEVFDIGGGWVSSNKVPGGSLKAEPYLKTLRRLHVSSGMHGEVPGYTDQIDPDGLFTRYPIKMTSRLQPLERFDRDEVLPRIHAVEFLGEPQYRAESRGSLPPAVEEAFRPYAASRLATSVTLSDASTWHLWSGLSDYPHYDAYRVTAPMADAWRLYERWGNVRIGWGAPLETIGDMTRSLRENSRPSPIAYWSQGPHAGWRGYDGRRRASPTPDELRLQAYHGLASRITSLYWYNLSLRSLVKYRDTLEELQRVGREIRLLEDYYLEGAAHSYSRIVRDGKLQADLAVIAAPRGAVLFAIDLDYRPDPVQKVFRFGTPRQEVFDFMLPSYLRKVGDVFRVDADGVHDDFKHEVTSRGVRVSGPFSKVGVWVAAPDAAERKRIAKRLGELLAYERAFDFDPARRDADFKVLGDLLQD